MATVQVTRQSRLADDGKMIVHPIISSPVGSLTSREIAATAALYVTHPKRRASLRDPTATNTQHFSE